LASDRPRRGAGLRASRGFLGQEVRRGFRWLDWGRFHWRDAAVGPGVRAALGVVTPLAIGTAVGQVEYGTYAALGALPAGFVTFSGVTRARVLNVSAAAVGMAISAFIGSATGSMPWVMVPVVLIWGYATGIVSALGPTAISIAQQCAVALLVAYAVPLGVGPAAIRAALVLAGGLWQGALVASSWTLSRGAAERTALAASYDVLSLYAAQPAGSGNGELLLDAMPASEALSDPNPLLRSGERLSLVNLAEEAERIRVSLTAIKAVADAESATGPRSLLQASAYALADIAEALSARGSRRQREQLRSLARSGERIAAITPPRDAGWRWVAEGLLGQLRSAIRLSELLLGAKPPGRAQRPPQLQQRRAQPAAAPRRRPAELRHELLLTLRACVGPSSEAGGGLWQELVTLRACLGPSSEAGRHALRLGVIAALTELLVRTSGLSHGYWAVLTVFIVLRPDYSSTLQRGVQRAGGTVVGAGLGIATALLANVGTPALLVGTGVSLAAAYSVFTVNFLLLGVFLTDFVVVFLALLGLPADQTALARLAGTGVGAALALIGYVVWPTWAGASANEKFAVLLEDQGRYAAALLRAYSRPTGDDAARLRSLQLEGRRAHSDADASAERLIDEPPKPPMTAELARALIAETERLATAELVLQAALTADGQADAVPSPQAGPGQALLDRLAAGLGTASDVLAGSLRALKPPGPLPPLREFQAAVSGRPDAGRVLLTTTDAMVDAVNSTTDILRRYLNGGQKQGSIPPRERRGGLTVQEPDDRGGQGLCDQALEGGRYQHLGVGGVAHVPALDQHLRDRGQVEAREVLADHDSLVAVVGALRHGGHVREKRLAHVAAEPRRRRDHRVVRPVGGRLEDREPPPRRGPAVPVDVDRDVGMRGVDDLAPAVDARPDAVVAASRHHHGRPVSAQVGPQVAGDIEVELRLGVAAVGLGPRRVAGFPLPAVPDLMADVGRIGEVPAVVARVDADDLPGERPRGAGRRPPAGVCSVAGTTRGCG
jgi:uncharacterized membrane protein YccC